MTRRIFKSIFITALLAVLMASVFIMLTLYNAYEARMVEELKTETGYILHALSKEQSDIDYFKGLASKNRVTLISGDGAVLFDNTADASKMENHADRPEIVSAINNGSGESRRYSNTLSEKTIYYAVLTDEGNILRVSNTQSTILGLILSMITTFLLIITGVAILSMIIAKSLSKRIVAPINALDLDAPLENDAYDELSPLLRRMEHQNAELRRRLAQLADKQREFATVTDNMREGLVLLDASSNVLFINTSASRIFDADSAECTGTHILSLNRSEELQNVVAGAQNGESTEGLIELDHHYYQLLASPFSGASGIRGILMLMLNVTDKQETERSRREFTANVSHELKTPLTSIMGYAEIMKNGVARQEDTPRFASRIYDEANRLLSLVDDILRLSHIDEKTKLPEKQSVDLLSLAHDVCGRLKTLADKNEVSVSVSGRQTVIIGIDKLLDEMLYNLCDNAVKYNVPGGTVTIDVGSEDGKAVLTVKDTGIGIPADQQPHVFERFYRVDKSHSKETGGTGLGLSIVKHVASVHDASIELVSAPGEGTKIRLTFS